MKSSAIFLFICLIPGLASAQELAGNIGVSGSYNMGELPPAPTFQSTFTIGDRLRLEDGFEFNSMDKYTHAGWYIKDSASMIFFPSDSGFFVVGSADYSHRNGGIWAKDGVSVGFGGGFEKNNTQYRVSIKERIKSWNDNIIYSPFTELMVRGDYPLGQSNWSVRVQSGLGVFKYIQNENKRMAFYVDSTAGLVYKWQ